MFFRYMTLVLLFVICGPASQVFACYAVVVGREASSDGSVLVGHNEQNGGRRILNFRRIPRRPFADGTAVSLRRDGKLAQVPETAAFFWSENPGLEFSDAYLNEWGVGVVSDRCPTREDDYETLIDRGEIRSGGIGYMLRRLVAERAEAARQGVKLAGWLVEHFGYVDTGRSYVIADPREAWVFAAVRGRRWVARRVPDDCVVILPNVHIIGRIDLADTDNFLASADLVDYAAQRGWFDPEGSEPFNFRRVYSARRGGPPDPRRLRGREMVLGPRETAAEGEELAFGVRPAKKMTVAAVVAILRDKAGPVPLSTPVTQEGGVFQLRADMPTEIGCVYWRTTAEPATSVLTPWYVGITETPPAYFRSVAVEKQVTLGHHFEPPQDTFDFDWDLAWWRFKSFQDRVYRDYPRRIAAVAPAWKAFEDRLFQDQQSTEAKAMELWKTDPEAARRLLTEYCADVAARARGEAEKLSGAMP